MATSTLVAVEPWVRANVLGTIADALEAQGRSIQQLFDRHQITTWKIHNNYQEIPLSDYISFFEDAAEVADDPYFGLRLGARFQPESFGPMGGVFRSSANLHAALSRLAVYLRAVRGGTRVDLIVHEDHAEWIYEIEGASAAPRRQETEFALAASCGFIRGLLGEHWAPIEVHLEHGEELTRPRQRSVPRRIFQAPVLYNQGGNRLILHTRDLARSAPRNRDAQSPYAERYFRELLTEVAGKETVAGQVRYLIARRLGNAGLDLGSLASELGLSARTLQRRLADEGVSVRTLIEEQRKLVAEALLSRKSVRIGSVAQNLGYSDPAVLCRAFRTWKGSSPSAFRNKS